MIRAAWSRKRAWKAALLCSKNLVDAELMDHRGLAFRGFKEIGCRRSATRTIISPAPSGSIGLLGMTISGSLILQEYWGAAPTN
jgi:hypothetical protein